MQWIAQSGALAHVGKEVAWNEEISRVRGLTMSDLSLELLIIFFLLIANGVFAMAEIAVVSARKARLKQLADQGNARARIALEVAQEPMRFLSTVQVGVTLLGALTGVFGGAELAS